MDRVLDENGKPLEPAPNAKIRDFHEFETLMRLSPTLADTAAFFKCGEQTVLDTIRRHYDLTFREFREKGAVQTRLGLQRKAVQMANSGNVTMLIFSLKNLCKWSDKVDIGGEEGKPFTLNYKVDEPKGDKNESSGGDKESS